MSRPASTRKVEARTVISTAIAGFGALTTPAPICQRCAVLKNFS